jgi:hypothetical protein
MLNGSERANHAMILQYGAANGRSEDPEETLLSLELGSRQPVRVPKSTLRNQLWNRLWSRALSHRNAEVSLVRLVLQR